MSLRGNLYCFLIASFLIDYLLDIAPIYFTASMVNVANDIIMYTVCSHFMSRRLVGFSCRPANIHFKGRRIAICLLNDLDILRLKASVLLLVLVVAVVVLLFPLDSLLFMPRLA